MSFKIEDDNIFFEYGEIWIKIKKTLNINFYSQPIYDEKYIKPKVKAFNEVVNTVFSDNEIPNGINHYTCIGTIYIDSAMKIDKKNYPQVYLEQCKYKKKIES